jgi:hypothetical protein
MDELLLVDNMAEVNWRSLMTLMIVEAMDSER